MTSLNQDIGDVSAGLAALMDCLHEDSTSFDQPMGHWQSWLEDEGFNAVVVGAWFLELSNTLAAGVTAEQLQAFYSTGVAKGLPTGAFVEVLNEGAPGFLEAVQERVDALIEADLQARHVAGGTTSKGLNVRPAYLAAGGGTALALYVLHKSGYGKRAYTWTREAASDLWTSVKETFTTAKTDFQTAKSDAKKDLIRDTVRPGDLIDQVEEIEPVLPAVALDVSRLDSATMAEVKGAAAFYAKRDIDAMFSETKFANSEWYQESKGLIDTTLKLDKTSYLELKSAFKGDGDFKETSLAKRFQGLDFDKTDGFWTDGNLVNSIGRIKSNDPRVGMFRDKLQIQLQASYENVLVAEVKEARQIEIHIERDQEWFEEDIATQAKAECVAVRRAAVEALNRDMTLAKEASKKAGGEFVDVEKQLIVRFESDAEAIIERE